MATTILIAIDFEDASRHAAEVARDLAQALGAELCLAHVYSLPVYTYPGLEPQLLPDLTREITLAATRALADLGRELGISRTVLREGDAARGILDAAREVGASMIAMGTHGRRGLSHVLLGSVAEKVVRTSTVPVLTIRAPQGGATGSG
jgi:nucleotide-binding universal stress UspA family protein